MKDFDSQTEQIRALFTELKLDQADALIESLKPAGRRERRLAGYLKGRLKSLQGRHEEALALLEQTLLTEGEHISILSEISNSLYQLGRANAWAETVERLHHTLSGLSQGLAPEEEIPVCIRLIQFREEQGQWGRALSLCEGLLGRYSAAEHPIDHARILAQMLRILSSAGETARNGQYYNELLSFRADSLPPLRLAEIRHSLMLSEICLIGPSAARPRLAQTLADPLIADFLKRLFWFDYLDTAWASGGDAPGIEGEIPPVLIPLPSDPFEEELALLHAGEIRFGDSIFSMAGRMSLACYLRLLSHWHRRSPDQRTILYRQASLIISGLDKRSQGLWRRRFSISGNENAIQRVHLDPGSLTASVGDHTAEFRMQKTLWAILSVIARRPDCPIEVLCQEIYRAEPTESYFDRLRVNIRKLNAKLATLGLPPQTIRLSKTGAALAPKIELIA